jgi:hypothetical protein
MFCDGFYASTSGLPDGLFSYQKSLLWFILEDLGKENVGEFHVHWVF